MWENREKFSREIDIIVYSGKPYFDFDEVVAVPSSIVSAVVQVKGYIPNPSKDIQNIQENLSSATLLNPAIKSFCFVVTANSRKNYSTMCEDFSAMGIHLYSLWEMPGENAQFTAQNGFCDFVKNIASI